MAKKPETSLLILASCRMGWWQETLRGVMTVEHCRVTFIISIAIGRSAHVVTNNSSAAIAP
jgi:hypothetical protein